MQRETGLLLALRRVRAGRVIAHRPGLYTDHERPFPGVLIPFMRELLDLDQIRIGGDLPSPVSITEAGQTRLSELEQAIVHTGPDALPGAMSLLERDGWAIAALPGILCATRTWTDGSADTLVALTPRIAYGQREDPAEHLVWQNRGPMLTMIAALLDLPSPAEPGAPTTPLPNPNWS